MMDLDRPESTISSRQDESQVAGLSLLLDESEKPHGQQVECNSLGLAV
jgi:hypothetical protein